MAKKGENIYKRKDGRWEARYVKGHTPDGKTQYGYCYAKTYREVRDKLTQIKLAVLLNIPTETNAQKRLYLFCDEWMKLNRLKVKESTYVKYYSMIEKHIKPELGGFSVQAVTSLLIEDFTQHLLDEKLSVKTVKDTLVLLGSILKYAEKTCPDLLRRVEITYPKESRKEMRVLSQDEQKCFMEYLLKDMDNVRFGILLSLLTGLRIGEICALRWSDISLEEKTIRVGATMQRIKNMDNTGKAKTKIIISDPKSTASMRVIPLTDYAAGLCETMKPQETDAFVLSGDPEHYIEPRALQYMLSHITRTCGLEGVHFHTLRHTFATRCVEVDFEIKSLSEILGHSSPKVTLDRYVHSSMELKRRNMEKLSTLGL